MIDLKVWKGEGRGVEVVLHAVVQMVVGEERDGGGGGEERDILISGVW